MPIYEYRCQRCGHTLEVIQRFGDAPRRKCPACAGRLERLVSRTAFVLKGGGWYADDYSKNSKKTDKPTKKRETPTESPETSAAKSSRADKR